MSGIETLHSDLRAAWRAALLATPGLPSEWAWEGRAFESTVGVPFARESVRPILSRPAALGAGGTITHRFVCSVTLIYPAAAGLTAPEAAAGRVLGAFRPGRALTYGASSAVIVEASRAGAITEPAWLSVAVSVTLTAHTIN